MLRCRSLSNNEFMCIIVVRLESFRWRIPRRQKAPAWEYFAPSYILELIYGLYAALVFLGSAVRSSTVCEDINIRRMDVWLGVGSKSSNANEASLAEPRMSKNTYRSCCDSAPTCDSPTYFPRDCFNFSSRPCPYS